MAGDGTGPQVRAANAAAGVLHLRRRRREGETDPRLQALLAGAGDAVHLRRRRVQ